MPDEETKRLLNRNVKLFGVYKIFTKRVFLPLTTIYATQQAGLNIQQIGIAAVGASAASLLCDTVTGYWADVNGRRKSAQAGAILAAFSALLYIAATNFIGIFTASIVMAIGYSFLNGSMEALIHDSLVVLEQEDNYAKIASQAQSVSLIGNAVLISLVPMLYPIDKRLPFVVGTVAYLFLFYLASLLTEPKVHHNTAVETKVTFLTTMRLLLTRKTTLFFICAGFAYGLSTGTTDIFNLAIIKLGMQPRYLGILYGFTSVVGAALGLWIHKLKKLTFKQYAALDLFSSTVPFIMYGIFHSLPLAIISFVFSFIFWRYQSIMYQHYVLKAYGSTKYKATIISLISNFRSLHEIWLALLFTGVAKHLGILPSIAYGTMLPVLFLPFFLFSIGQFSANAKASLAVSDQ